jgi:uncharacterized membrane protein YgcG
VAPAELQQLLLDSLSSNAFSDSASDDHEQHQQHEQALHADAMLAVHATTAAAAAAVHQAAPQLQQHAYSKQQQQLPWHAQAQAKQQMHMTPSCMGLLQQQYLQHGRFGTNTIHSKPSSSEDGSKSSSKDSSSTSGPSAGSSSSSSAGAAAASAPADFLAALLAVGSSSKAAQLTPAAITQQLDKHIVGQGVSGAAISNIK